MKEYYCYIHDIPLIKIMIDEDGEIESDEDEMDFESNGLACPDDDCTVIIYENK